MFPRLCLAHVVCASIFSALALVVAFCASAWSMTANLQLTVLTLQDAITQAVVTDPGLQGQHALYSVNYLVRSAAITLSGSEMGG